MTDYDSINKRGAPRATDWADETPQDLLPRCPHSDCDALLDIHIITEGETLYRRERCEEGHLIKQIEIDHIDIQEIRGP